MKLDFSDIGGGKAATATVAGAGAQLDFSDLIGPTTPSGVPLTPVEMEESTASDEMIKEAMTEDFMAGQQSTRDLLEGMGFDVPAPEAPDLSVSGLLTQELKDAYDTQQKEERARVNRVLYDLVPNYAGGEDDGVLTFGDRDKLARMPRFEQRERWLRKKFPDGQLFRVDTGGGDLVELYRTSPAGKVYRVSNDVLSFGDAGAVTGSILNFTTAGSVVGSLFSPFFGTAGGAYLGATIDDYIANGLATDAFTSLGIKDSEEFNTRLLSGDRAVVALVDGVLTKVLPGMGRGGAYLLRKSAEFDVSDTSLLYELGLFSVSDKAAAAQKSAAALSAATGVELPQLNISQLSNNILLRGMASQASGTAGRLPRALSTQESRLLTALQTKVKESGGDFGALSTDELSHYILLSQKALADDVALTYRAAADGNYALRDLPDSAVSLVDNAKQLDAGLARAIDEQYKKAFSLAGAENVTFDLTPVLAVAKEVRAGLRVTKQPEVGRSPSGIPLVKGKDGRTVFGAEVDVRSRPFGGELAAILDRLENVFDPTLKTVNIKGVKGETASRNIDAFQQLKDIRDQLQDLASTEANPTQALKVLNAVDDLIINGIEKGYVKGGSDAWRTAYNQAGALVRTRADAKQFSGIGTLLGRKSDNLPVTVSEALVRGNMNGEQFTILKRLANNNALNPAEKASGQQFITDIREVSLASIIRDPENAMSRIADIKAVDDGRLYNDLFPVGSPSRKALDALEIGASQLATDPVQAALNKSFTNGTAAKKYIETLYSDQQDLAVQRFITANGGVNGEAASQIRASLLKDILDRSSIVQREGGTAEFADDIIDSSKLSKELSDLKDFRGQYAAFKPLFGTVDDVGKLTMSAEGRKYFNLITDAQLYGAFLANSGDIGGPFATGAIRSAVTSGTVSSTLGAFKSLYTNRILARIFAATPSASQLQRALNQKQYQGRVNAAVTLLNQMVDGLNIGGENSLLMMGSSLGPETQAEETRRTGKFPQLGNVPPRPKPIAIPAPPPPLPPAAKARRALGSGINTIDNLLQKNKAMQQKVNQMLQTTQATPTGTSFESLFPGDTLGSAIAGRRNQGIAGLV